MFDLYNLLASGHTPDEVAAQFTQALNDAETRLKKEEEERQAREAAKAEERKNESQKREDFKDLARHFFEVMARHYPDSGFTEGDITDEMCYAIGDLMMMSAQLDQKIKVQVKRVPAEDVFAKFFKQFGLN